MAEVEHRPTILMVGQGEPMQTELGEALRRHGMSVAGCATAELENAVRVYAPDLVVLIGDAAVRGGASVVRRMATNCATDVLPVAIVSNDAGAGNDGRGFRTGAVAVVPRGAGPDAIARRLSELAYEVPDRPGMRSGRLDENNLRDIVEIVSNETKTGLLSIRSPRGTVQGMPMVIETEAASAHNMELILDRLRHTIHEAEPLEYEFHETSRGRLSTLPSPIEPAKVDLSELDGARVVILDADELRAEKLAQVLMARGVRIAAADISTAVIPRVREIDPQVVVLDSSAVGGQGLDFVRALRKDPQLRWASMLVVRWEDFWPSSAEAATPDVAQLASRICPLIEQDREISKRVEHEVDFDTRLELVGPGRLLRALGSVPGVRHVAISGHKRSVEIDIADNSIVGAYATLHEASDRTLQAMPALLAAWGMTAGRVSVREQDLPSVANIMMPVDEALGVVSHELGFADGGQSDVEATAATVPPEQPAVDEHATVPPGARDPVVLDEARTMAPPRFKHRRATPGTPFRWGFAEEEAPTHKVAQLLGRVDTRQQTVPAPRGALESGASAPHTDHAVPRSKKATELGLAPAFEALADEEPMPEATAPPPPAQPKRATPTPLFDGEDDLGPLAPTLEGATITAPAAPSGGMPARLQGLLLLTLVVGVGVAGWLLWSSTGAPPPPEVDTTQPERPDSREGPITGTVNGLGADEPTGREQRRAEDAPNTSEEPAQDDAGPTGRPAEPEASAGSPPSTALEIPTQDLPRDPAKASDVLVYRALRLIRRNELDVAEATLDRAWELDPNNPRAMAGYAALYLERDNAELALKWARQAVRRRSKRTRYHILYGDALALQGHSAQARRAWRKALALDPGNSAARSRLAGKSGPEAK